MSLEQTADELRTFIINDHYPASRTGFHGERHTRPPLLVILRMLKILQSSVDTALFKIDDVSDRIHKLEHKLGNTEKKFEACADGFYQIREACTTLREELAEASGTLIEATYN